MSIISLHIKREGGGELTRGELKIGSVEKGRQHSLENLQVNVMIILLCICDHLISVEIHLSLENVFKRQLSYFHTCVSGFRLDVWKTKYIETCIGGKTVFTTNMTSK